MGIYVLPAYAIPFPPSGNNGKRLHDVDLELASILKHGAPTGVRCAIPYSGVWPQKFGSDSCDMCCIDDLEFCEQNHLSAELDPARVEQLLQEEVAKGYVEKFTGSEADLRQRFKRWLPGSWEARSCA